MKKTLILVAMILGLAVAGYAIRVQPGSNASGDSANTAETLVYRDASGNFAAGAITATTIAVTAQSGAVLLASKTKAQFDTLDPAAIGELYVCSDCTEVLACISTGTAVAQWQRMDSPTAGCGSNE